jgi:hypothetical protein
VLRVGERQRARRAHLAALAVVAVLGSGIGLAAAEPAADPPTAPSEPTATMRAAGSDVPELPSRIQDGPRVALPPMVIRPEPPAPDNRPAYVGGGIVVLAALFWWNRRQRDRFEREDEAAPRRATQARRARREARDDDADDLHAAARGDAPDPPDAAEAPTKKSP